MIMKCGDLKKVEHFRGNEENFYIATLIRNRKVFNITYDCNRGNLLIHEWYKLSKKEINEITNELSMYFRSIKKEVA